MPVIVKQGNVKYVCTRCGYIGKMTLFEKIIYALHHMAIGFCIICFAFIMFIGILSHGNLVGSFLTYMQIIQYNSAYEADFDLKEAVIAPVKFCRGDEDCIIVNMAKYLHNRTTYVAQGAEQDPMTTLRIGGGNCEDLSVLTVGALSQFGIKAFVNCNVGEHHCFAVVYPAGKNYLYIIDLAKSVSFIERLDIGSDPWSFYA